MNYIIENATILKDSQLTMCSLLVKENIIAERKPRFNRYKYMKMNTEDFIMTPSFVLLDSKLPLHATFHELRNYLIEQFLLKGCTTLLTYVKVSIESELTKKINEVKTALISSPIDYVIGVCIPVRLITPSFIRKCKKDKVPAIFIEINNLLELEKVPWGWIKEAMFPYNCPLIPIISDDTKKEVKNALSKWKSIMEKEKISALWEELTENNPLSIPKLNKLGIYPQKSSLLHGSELSYNLYLKEREINNVDEVKLFHYHGDRLVITVHKGRVVRAGDEVLFKSGYGEYVKVRTPSYFSF